MNNTRQQKDPVQLSAEPDLFAVVLIHIQMLLVQSLTNGQRQDRRDDDGHRRVKTGGRQLADHCQKGSLMSQTMEQQAGIEIAFGQIEYRVGSGGYIPSSLLCRSGSPDRLPDRRRTS